MASTGQWVCFAALVLIMGAVSLNATSLHLTLGAEAHVCEARWVACQETVEGHPKHPRMKYFQSRSCKLQDGKITGIHAMDRSPDYNGVATVVNGGVGHKEVTLHLKSKMGEPLLFDIVICAQT